MHLKYIWTKTIQNTVSWTEKLKMRHFDHYKRGNFDHTDFLPFWSLIIQITIHFPPFHSRFILSFSDYQKLFRKREGDECLYMWVSRGDKDFMDELEPRKKIFNCPQRQDVGACNFFDWCNAPMCARSKELIPGFLRVRREMEVEISPSVLEALVCGRLGSLDLYMGFLWNSV